MEEGEEEGGAEVERHSLFGVMVIGWGCGKTGCNSFIDNSWFQDRKYRFRGRKA